MTENNEDLLRKISEENHHENDSIDSLDQEIERLQTENTVLKKEKKDERFIWVLVTIILLDAHWFSTAQSWGGPIVIGVIELFVLLVMAERLDIRTLTGIIDRLFNVFDSNKNNTKP